MFLENKGFKTFFRCLRFVFMKYNICPPSTAMSTVTGDLGIPEQAQHIKSVEEMENYR